MARRAFLHTFTLAIIAALFLHGSRVLAAVGEEDWLSVSIERKTVHSTNLISFGYNRILRVLEIEFRSGGIYRYRDVTNEVFEALVNAESKGRYFSQHIRGRYEYHRTKESRP